MFLACPLYSKTSHPNVCIIPPHKTIRFLPKRPDTIPCAVHHGPIWSECNSLYLPTPNSPSATQSHPCPLANSSLPSMSAICFCFVDRSWGHILDFTKK